MESVHNSEIRQNQKQSMLLTKEEAKLIQRIRQLRRRPENCFIVVEPASFLSWFVTGCKES